MSVLVPSVPGGGSSKTSFPIEIYVKSPPDKVNYLDGDALTLEGLVVMCKFTDGTETDVSSVITTIPAAGTEVHEGDNLIDIRYDYQGLATFKTQQIIEATNPVVSIAVTKMPDKVQYRYDEPFDATGLVVTATYYNGKTANITQNCIFDPAVGEFFEGSGEQAVQISYMEDKDTVETSFIVDVQKELKYYGTGTALSKARYGIGASTIDHYALFAGGFGAYVSPATSVFDTVDTYDSSLVKGTAGKLSEARGGCATASVGDYALFAGGDITGNQGGTTTVDAYNSSLVQTTTSLYGKRYTTQGASVGDYAIFASGATHTSTYYSDSAVSIFDSELVRTTSSLSEARSNHTSASVGDYAIFAGGKDSDYLSSVEAYSSSLVRTSLTGLNSPRVNVQGASVGNYALFAGGYYSWYRSYDREYIHEYYKNVDVYNSELVKTTATDLQSTRSGPAGASTKAYAVFAGGVIDDYTNTNHADGYDENLVHTIPGNLSKNISGLSATSVGGYILFAGGNLVKNVNVYEA